MWKILSSSERICQKMLSFKSLVLAINPRYSVYRHRVKQPERINISETGILSKQSHNCGSVQCCVPCNRDNCIFKDPDRQSHILQEYSFVLLTTQSLLLHNSHCNISFLTWTLKTLIMRIEVNCPIESTYNTNKLWGLFSEGN